MSRSRVTLGDVADFINGVAFKPADWEESGKRIIRIQNLTDSKKPFNRTNRAVAKKYEVAPGDLLVSWSATLGVFVWEGPDTALVNQHIFRVVPHHGRIDLSYLRHMLSDTLVQMEKHLHGATMKHVNRGQFLGTKIPLPSLAKQKRIAGILDAADSLRAKRREAIVQLETLLQSTFLDMFGDPVTNPMGWDERYLPDLVSNRKHALKRGPFGGALKKEIFVPEGFKVYEQKNVIYDDFHIGSYFIDRLDYERLSPFKVSSNNLLISCSGTIGRIAAVPLDATPGVMNQALLKIDLDESVVLNSFFLGLWRSQSFEQQVLGMTHGTGMKNMKSMAELKGIKFVAPPLDLQHRFAAIVESVEQQRARQRAHLAELDTLFASLQGHAFRGDL